MTPSADPDKRDCRIRLLRHDIWRNLSLAKCSKHRPWCMHEFAVGILTEALTLPALDGVIFLARMAVSAMAAP